MDKELSILELTTAPDDRFIIRDGILSGTVNSHITNLNIHINEELKSKMTLAGNEFNTANNLVQLDSDGFIPSALYNGGAAMPIGVIFLYASTKPPAGAFKLNGQTIINCKTLYPIFYNWLSSSISAGYIRAVSSNNIYEELLIRTGNCGAFYIDPIDNSVRLPSITSGFIEGGNTNLIGQSLEAGLPNITGSATILTTSGSIISNAFISNTVYNTAALNTEETSNILDGFDASHSNIIYGKSNTVQPAAVIYCYCIQVFNAATLLSEQETQELASLIQMKADLSLSNLNDTGIGKLNPPGTIIAFAGSAVPAGYLLCTRY